jgi:nucleotide-binding universal stress UspA family protein
VDAVDALRYSLHAAFARGRGLRHALDDQQRESQARFQAGKQHFWDFCKRHKVKVTDTPGWSLTVSTNWHEEPGHEEEPFLTRARAHDLVVMVRPTRPNGLPPNLLQRLVFDSGRPILIPAVKTRRNFPGTVMICWRDAAEPTRAITAAMPLLLKANRVIVASVEEASPLANIAAVARHLLWHGIRVETQTTEAGDRPIANLLSSIAKDCAADLLVMGAYGRGPLRETVFGGPTQSILEHADLPVFLLH